MGKITEPDSEGTEGLEYYLLDDGTYGVKGGTTNYLSEITIPSTHNGKVVTTILSSAFYEYANLTKINIPESITTIPENAFYNCASLKEINIPRGVTKIGKYAFYNCASLKEINISEGVTEIGEYAFNQCNNVVSISLPSTINYIGKYGLCFGSPKKVEQVDINFDGIWRVNMNSTISSPNGNVYSKSNDGSYKVVGGGYSYSYLFIDDVTKFENNLKGKIDYYQYSNYEGYPNNNRYILTYGSTVGEMTRID